MSIFFGIGKIPLSKVIYFPQKTSSDSDLLAYLSDKPVPTIRFSLKKNDTSGDIGTKKKHMEKKPSDLAILITDY